MAALIEQLLYKAFKAINPHLGVRWSDEADCGFSVVCTSVDVTASDAGATDRGDAIAPESDDN